MTGRYSTNYFDLFQAGRLFDFFHSFKGLKAEPLGKSEWKLCHKKNVSLNFKLMSSCIDQEESFHRSNQFHFAVYWSIDIFLRFFKRAKLWRFLRDISIILQCLTEIITNYSSNTIFNKTKSLICTGSLAKRGKK